MHFLRKCFAWRWLIAGFVLGATLLSLPTPEGLTPEGQRALTIAAVATLFFITEPIPLPAVALLIAVFQVLLGLGSGNEVAKSFMSDSVFFIMGSLMMSVALVKQQLDRRIAYGILKLTGPSVTRIVFGFAGVSALLASFIGEHTVAAMMLPVALAILSHVRKEPQQIKHLAALLLFSIAYGTAIAGIGTPSGGARNAIMIDYWRELGHIQIGYLDWMVYTYPLVIAQIPLLVGVLLWTFPAEVKEIRRALVRLRQEVHSKGALSAQDKQVIAVFLFIMLCWITLGQSLGLGIIAIMGAALYLILGLVRWEDLNNGVNWGVVWLYAAAISMGVQTQNTGAAQWVAENFLSFLSPLHLDSGLPLLMALSVLAVLVTHTMSAAAAVAVLGPIALQIATLSGDSLMLAGFATTIGAAFSYMVVASQPSLTIVYSSGYLSSKDFLKVGSRMLLASLLILWLAMAVYWPWLGA